MSNENPKKVDPAYPSSDGLSKAGEAAASVLAGAAGFIVPVVGSAAVQTIVKNVVQMPVELRRADWFKSVGEGLRELQDRLEGFDPAKLGENEEFVSVVVEATAQAMKTHREEKRAALRNAVLNTALNMSIDEVLRGSFLAAIDRFSPLHLRVLNIEGNSSSEAYRKAAGSMYMGSRSVIIRNMIPQNEASEESLRRVYDDLRREGMTNGNEFSGMSTDGLFSNNTTRIGDAFLHFISDPVAS